MSLDVNCRTDDVRVVVKPELIVSLCVFICVCVQVVEIQELTKHSVNECEKKTEMNKCSRCSEAIPKAEFKAHTSAKSCLC